jgi:predicted transcriptional regulator of viral defense system
MDTIRLTGALIDQGFSYDELARLSRRGELDRVRRGAYSTPPESALSRGEAHRRLIHATLPQLIDGSVVSHGSAATLHGLPFWNSTIARVHVTRPGEGQRRPLLHLHCAPLTRDDIVLIDGIPVTSLARTVLDLARTTRMEYAVAAADRALRDGLDRQQLAEGLFRMYRWPGVRAARRVVLFANPQSESVGESVSRVRLHLDGLPTPELQYEVRGPGGLLIATCDFGWRKQQTVGEFDGKIKYGRLLKPGQQPEDVVFAEKLREDAVRAEDHEVARWTWDDCWKPGAIRNRVLRAFTRNGSL